VAADAPQKTIKMLGQFELISKIGQGGMGSVFKAKQVTMDRLVAVKILPPSIAKNSKFVDRFIREARTSAKLNHPNIVQGIEVGQDETTQLYYFAMEYVDGPTVKVLLKQEKIIEERRAMEIITGVAQALVCAQRAGIVHRDIKPDNILLTSKGEVKLADLGLARGNFDNTKEEITPDDKNRKSSSSLDLTQIGVTLGTPNYMAPEQIRGDIEKLDVRTDLYALGATWFHMATGRVPFVAPNSSVIMDMHLTAPIPDPREVNEAINEDVAEVIMKLMQKDPAERFQSASDLVQALEAMEHGQYEQYKTKTAKQRTGVNRPVAAHPLKRSQSQLATLVVVVLALVGGVIGLNYLRRSAANTPAVVVAPQKESPPAVPTPPPTPEPATPPSKPEPAPPQPIPAKPVETEVAKKDDPPKENKPEPKPVQRVADKAPAPPPPEPAKQPPPKPVSIDEEAAGLWKEAVAKFDLSAAHQALNAFEDERKVDALQRTSLNLALETAIEAKGIELSNEAKKIAGEGDLEKALELLNGAKFPDGELSNGEVVAKATITGTIDTLGRDKFLKEMAAGIKKWDEMDNILTGVTTALEHGRLEVAAKWLEAAQEQAVNAHLADDLKREREMLGWFAEMDAATEKGCEAIGSDNRAFTLIFNDGRKQQIGENTKIKAVKAKDGSFSVEVHDQKGMSYINQIKIADLSPETHLQLALAGCDQDNGEQLGGVRAKFAYMALTSFSSARDPRNGARLDEIEKLLQEARTAGASEDVLNAVQPWLLRVQSRVRNPKGIGKNRLTPYLQYVQVHSAGNAAGSKVKIVVNSLTMIEGAADHNGLNVVAIDSGKLLLKEKFDTSKDTQAGNHFYEAISKLPKGALVICAACDEASMQFNARALQAIKLIGAKTGLFGQPHRSSFICIGLVGLDEGYAFEQCGMGALDYPPLPLAPAK
jgi:serine/threonine-protein kinase